MVSASLRVELLGGFGLSKGDQPITGINTPRLQSLAAYLILHHSAPQSRQHVAFLFWPDTTDAQARNNLRQALHHLRAALPDVDRMLHADATSLRWQSDAAFTLDVIEFEAAIEQARASRRVGDDATAQAAYERAVRLYRGDLLPSCYDDWVAPERERLRQQNLDALQHLVEFLEKSRDYEAALQHAQRLLALDSMNERAHLDMMRLHALNGDRASALRAYHLCVSTLQRELGAHVEPGRAIQDAYAQLLSKDVAGAHAAVVPTRSAPDFVGRQPEWQMLLGVWHGLRAGQARCAIIGGEAGIGKTRLAEEMANWADAQGIHVATARAYAIAGSLALAPVTEWLRGEAIRPSLAKLEPLWQTEIARLLPELLIERPDLPRPEAMTDYWQRQRFFEALARAVTITGAPLILLIDDLQWCDIETFEWLHYFLRFNPGGEARLLVIGTARTEEVDAAHPLTRLTTSLRAADQLTEVMLGRLDAAETARLAASMAGRDLSSEAAGKLFDDTEGNPLFVVETVRADQGLREPASGAAPLPSKISNLQALPPKVYAVIAGRLAQLTPSARAFAQLAATVGREFTFDVLFAASESDEDSLVHALDELWQRRIIRERGADGYDFSHDKIRDVANAETSSANRRLLHRRVAKALESVHAADLDRVSAQLAAHYEQAGMPDRAIMYYERAAEVTQRMYANEETVSLIRRALALLPGLPDSSRRQELNLTLSISLGLALVATHGYNAPEVRDVFTRAQALGEQLGRPPHPPILRALAISYLNANDFRRGRVLGEQLLLLAEQLRDPVLVVEGHYVLGVTLFWLGSFAPARTHLAQAIAHYDPEQSHLHISQYSQDPNVICQSRLAFDLWCLGYPDHARRHHQESLRLARTLAHPYSLAYALVWGAMLHCALGEAALTRSQAEEGIALSHERVLGLWPSWATVLRGWAIAAAGEPRAGVAEIERGRDLMQSIGSQFIQPLTAALLAEQYMIIGGVEHGLTLLDAALTGVARHEGRWWEAELHRVRGELLLQRGEDTGEGEAAYCRAIEVAQEQQARSFELRAALGLARLWQAQNRARDARDLLQPIYAWFSEGFDTRDLKAAQALLAHLAN